MVDYEDVITNYKKALKKIEIQEKEIIHLRNELSKYKKLAENVSYYKLENKNLTKANIKLADAIKRYNPRHFGKTEEKQSDLELEEENWL